MSLLGESLTGLRRFEAAEPIAIKGYELIASGSTSAAREKRRVAIEQIVALYEAWNDPDKAATWRAKLRRDASPNRRRKPP